MFRDFYSIAWEFHRNTTRWPYNILTPDDEQSGVAPFKEYCSLKTIPLPDTGLPSVSISELIEARCSCRNYKGRPVELEKIAVILKTGYGVLGKTFIEDMEFYERPVPSGVGLYSLELYLISLNIHGLEQGIYH